MSERKIAPLSPQWLKQLDARDNWRDCEVCRKRRMVASCERCSRYTCAMCFDEHSCDREPYEAPAVEETTDIERKR